jgi:hypothetical protein
MQYFFFSLFQQPAFKHNRDMAGKVKLEPVDGDYTDDLVPVLKLAETVFVSDWHAVNSTDLSSDSGDIKKRLD